MSQYPVDKDFEKYVSLEQLSGVNMPKIKWNESMSVGVPLFDQHHQKLFDIFNELTDHMDKGKGKDVIYKILDELLEYAKYHFEEEEQFMLKNFCPSYR